MPVILFTAALIAAASTPIFVEEPCEDERISAVARCGSVRVPEDHNRPWRRKITLKVIVLPALSPLTHSPPLFEIEGGPGLPATKNANFYVSSGTSYRVKRDIVMVDQRGTGGSNPLHCREFSKPDEAYLPLYPVSAVTRCRRALEIGANLTKYGTRDAVLDLDQVRAALGYEKIDLFGLSYGTTVALRYLATFPNRVRAAVLMGVSPATATPPKGHATAGERALNKLFDECKRDQACNASFDPAADVKSLKFSSWFRIGDLSEEVFFEKLRSLMYRPSTARMLPFIIQRAAKGDFTPFYSATQAEGSALFADGMHMSVVCSEGIALMDVNAATKISSVTAFGDYRLRRQIQACAKWPKAVVDENHLKPVRSSAAVLLISGELDPVTPPEWANEVATTLPNSKHIIIPGSGHILDGMTGVDTCLDPLIVSFLDAGDVDEVDANCIAEMKPPAFVTAQKTVVPD